MGTITLPNFRATADVKMNTRLKDGGVYIEWSSLTDIKAWIYSDAQKAIAGRCDVSVNPEDNTKLLCEYAASKPQYLGVNRLIVQGRYLGSLKTYDKPVFNFVARTAEQADTPIEITDPEVDVEIEVTDTTSSILDNAIAAALQAAEDAEHAAHLVPLEVLQQCEQATEEALAATEAANEAAETAMAAGIDDVEASIADDEPGTPSVDAELLNKVLSLVFHHLKGAKGEKGDTGATPNITVGTVATGEPGTPVVVTITGTAEAPVLNITIPQGLKGDQGNTGSSVEYPFELVNNETTDDATKAHTAAGAKRLKDEVSQLEDKVDNLIVLNLENKYMAGYKLVFTDNNKRLANTTPYKVGTGTRLQVRTSNGTQVSIAFFDTTATDVNRTYYYTYTGDGMDIVAPSDYVVFTFKKIVGGTEQVISPSDINYTIKTIPIIVERKLREFLVGKAVSVCGDSISTYRGYCGNNPVYYPNGDVLSVDNTWWYKFIIETGATLTENISYAGALVSNDGVHQSLIPLITSAQSTDLMLLSGGVNDTDNNVTIGVLDFAKATEDLNDATFADAYLHLVRIAMQKATEVVIVIPDSVGSSYADTISRIASYYHLPCVNLIGKVIGKVQTSHPDKNGMMAMTSALLNIYSDTAISGINTAIESLDGRLLKSPKVNPKDAEYLDFGELGNYTSLSGAYTLTPRENRISTVVPIFVGKGNIVLVSGKPGWQVTMNQYATIESGAARVTDAPYQSLSSDITYLMIADYLFLTFKKDDDSRIFPNEVGGYVTGFNIYKIPIVNSSKFYAKERYGQSSLLDLSDVVFQRGNIKNDGDTAYSVRRMVSQFIPVKPGTAFHIHTEKDDNDISIDATVFFYHIEQDGTFTFIDDYYFNTSQTVSNLPITSVLRTIDVLTPPTANAFRFYAETSDQQEPTVTQISDLLEITCHTSEYIRECEFLPIETENKVISFNNIDIEWQQGIGVYDTRPAMKCITTFFKVFSGQRLIFRKNNQNRIYQIRVQEFETLGSTYSRERVFGMGYVYVPRVGVKYIRVIASADSDGPDSITPQMCVEDNWHLVDASANRMSLQHAEKVLELSRASYAQGMAIQNGYLFQAFADGYIDIYDINSLAFVQSVFVPLSSDTTSQTMHCNNITFGDKYDAGDEFGVLWVNNEGSRTNFIGVRVEHTENEFSFTKVYEVTPPRIPDGYIADDQYFDFKNKRMVQVAYRLIPGVVYPDLTGYSDITIWLYDWAGDLQDGNFTLVHSFDFPIVWAMQGGRFIDGILYLVSGKFMNAINVFNVLTKEMIGIIDLTNGNFNITNEAQGFDWNVMPYITSTDATNHKWWLHKLFL